MLGFTIRANAIRQASGGDSWASKSRGAERLHRQGLRVSRGVATLRGARCAFWERRDFLVVGGGSDG